MTKRDSVWLFVRLSKRPPLTYFTLSQKLLCVREHELSEQQNVPTVAHNNILGSGEKVGETGRRRNKRLRNLNKSFRVDLVYRN